MLFQLCLQVASGILLLGLNWDVAQPNQNFHHWLQIDLVTSCSRRLTTFVILLIILVEHHGGILEKLFFLPYFCFPFPSTIFLWKKDLSYLVAYTSCNLAKINCHVFLASSSSYSECDVFLDDAFLDGMETWQLLGKSNSPDVTSTTMIWRMCDM